MNATASFLFGTDSLNYPLVTPNVINGYPAMRFFWQPSNSLVVSTNYLSGAHTIMYVGAVGLVNKCLFQARFNTFQLGYNVGVKDIFSGDSSMSDPTTCGEHPRLCFARRFPVR